MKKHVVNFKFAKLKRTYWPNWSDESKSGLKTVIFEDLIADTINKRFGHFSKHSDVMS